MADDQDARRAGALACALAVEEYHAPDTPRRSHAQLPTLFGRFTAVLGNNRRLVPLDQRLELLSALLGTDREVPGDGPEPQLLFAEASRELSEQFATEEAYGYYGVVLEEQPALGPSVSELKREHVAILRALDVLQSAGSDGTLRRELGTCTRGLVSKLRAHEQGERLLLRDLFSGPDARSPSRSGTYNRAPLADGESPLLVLLVEDEVPIRSVVRRMLEGAGCGVVEAPDAKIALRLLLERRSEIGAIVSDVGLPEISGPDFVRAARVLCPHIAAMHMSGDARDHLVATGRIAADAVLLEKPFRRSDLVACLTAVLARHG